MITTINENNLHMYQELFDQANDILNANKDDERLSGINIETINSLASYYFYLPYLCLFSNTFLMLPLDEPMSEIDPQTRTINMAGHAVFAGVQGDHEAKTIVFNIPLYYESMDFSTCDIFIEWSYTDSDGNIRPGYTPISYREVYEDNGVMKMKFPWTITKDLTQLVGSISFSIRFAKKGDQEDVLVYSLNTLVHNINVSSTLNPNMDYDGADKKNDGFIDLKDIVTSGAMSNLESAKHPKYVLDLDDYKVFDSGESKKLKIRIKKADMGDIAYSLIKVNYNVMVACGDGIMYEPNMYYYYNDLDKKYIKDTNEMFTADRKYYTLQNSIPTDTNDYLFVLGTSESEVDEVLGEIVYEEVITASEQFSRFENYYYKTVEGTEETYTLYNGIVWPSEGSGITKLYLQNVYFDLDELNDENMLIGKYAIIATNTVGNAQHSNSVKQSSSWCIVPAPSAFELNVNNSYPILEEGKVEVTAVIDPNSLVAIDIPAVEKSVVTYTLQKEGEISQEDVSTPNFEITEIGHYDIIAKSTINEAYTKNKISFKVTEMPTNPDLESVTCVDAVTQTEVEDFKRRETDYSGFDNKCFIYDAKGIVNTNLEFTVNVEIPEDNTDLYTEEYEYRWVRYIYDTVSETIVPQDNGIIADANTNTFIIQSSELQNSVGRYDLIYACEISNKLNNQQSNFEPVAIIEIS